MECSACSGELKATKIKGIAVEVCQSCGGVHADGITLGSSYTIVKPEFEIEPTENERYYDFTCFSSSGIKRRHGWYCPESGRITQIG